VKHGLAGGAAGKRISAKKKRLAPGEGKKPKGRTAPGRSTLVLYLGNERRRKGRISERRGKAQRRWQTGGVRDNGSGGEMKKKPV